MKTFVFTFFLLVSNYSFSQSIDGDDLSDIDADYIEITVTAPGPGQRFIVDYGKALKFGDRNKAHVFLDEDGQAAPLRSPMSVINFMCNYGQYDLDKAFFTKVESGIIRTYILKKA